MDAATREAVTRKLLDKLPEDKRALAEQLLTRKGGGTPLTEALQQASDTAGALAVARSAQAQVEALAATISRMQATVVELQATVATLRAAQDALPQVVREHVEHMFR